jgi:hypothetical protein
VDVFISHSSKDKLAADAVCSVLENCGVRCWLAPRDILPGENYGLAIVNALNKCRVLVLILTPEANQSRHVIKEVERAVSKGSVLVPLRLQDIQPHGALEYFLSAEHWLDAITPPLQSHLDRLATIVKAILGTEDKLSKSTPIDRACAKDFNKVAPSEWSAGSKGGLFSMIRKLFEEKD